MAIDDIDDSLEDSFWKFQRMYIFIGFGVFIPLMYITFAVSSALN
jgi:hypothetical protein